MLHCVLARTVCRLGNLFGLVFEMAISNFLQKAGRTDVSFAEQQFAEPATTCAVSITYRLFGFGKGSGNRDRVILAFCGLAVEFCHLSQRHGATDD